MTNLLETALAIALEAHRGVLDKSGRPYILHPLYLMWQMDTEVEMVTAVLHDVVEDSAYTLDDLAAAGIPPRALAALALLTREPDDDYEAYVDAIAANPLARKVKLADLAHNMDVRRLPNPLTPKDLARLEKYHRAWDVLTRARDADTLA